MDMFQAVDVAGAGAHRDTWRTAFYTKSTAENPEAKRKTFNRAATDLAKLGKLTVQNDVFSLPSFFQKYRDISGTCPVSHSHLSGTCGTQPYGCVPLSRSGAMFN